MEWRYCMSYEGVMDCQFLCTLLLMASFRSQVLPIVTISFSLMLPLAVSLKYICDLNRASAIYSLYKYQPCLLVNHAQQVML
jgi:hypothetical protein